MRPLRIEASRCRRGSLRRPCGCSRGCSRGPRLGRLIGGCPVGHCLRGEGLGLAGEDLLGPASCCSASGSDSLCRGGTTITVGGKSSLSGLSWPLMSPYCTGRFAASLGLALLGGAGACLGLRRSGIRTGTLGGDDRVCLPLRGAGWAVGRGDEAWELDGVGMSRLVKSLMVRSASRMALCCSAIRRLRFSAMPPRRAVSWVTLWLM